MKKIYLFTFIILVLFAFAACSTDTTPATDGNATENTTSAAITYEQITPEEAKSIMDSDAEYILIDARNDEEFATGHIAGAIMIPEYEIADRAETELPEKDALILVYCRSGRRSKIASEELAKLGYTNVKEFGGIIDWPYEIVQ